MVGLHLFERAASAARSCLRRIARSAAGPLLGAALIATGVAAAAMTAGTPAPDEPKATPPAPAPPADSRTPGGKSEQPLDVGTKEQVSVRLVTVDALVLDGKDRTVPDLKAEEFELEVDGQTTHIDTLDVTCPGGAADSPRAAKFGKWAETPSPSAPGRRIVLALDYLHLTRLPCPDLPGLGPCLFHTQVLRALQRTVPKTMQPGDEIMIAVIGGALRVEQPFTSDPAKVLQALKRMEYDVTLMSGRFSHVNELPFFENLESLIEVIDLVPGSKAIVIFTGASGPGDENTSNLMHLRTLATSARVALYPVDCLGLHSAYRNMFRWYGTGSFSDPPTPPGLLGLALETGGHLTQNTNDFTLGYARARRDLACRYTLGFYDSDPQKNRSHTLRVKVTRPGVRVVHPSAYEFRPAEEKKEAQLRAAFLVPEMFQHSLIRAHTFPLRPRSRKSWDCLVAIEFQVPFEAAQKGKAEREIGAVLRSGPNVVHTFSRRIALTSKNPGVAPSRRVSFYEPVSLAPGSYILNVVVHDPDDSLPSSTTEQVEIPAVPKGETFLVGPILGRKAGKDIVVQGSGPAAPGKNEASLPAGDRVGTAESFQPLLVAGVQGREPLFALTQACRVRPRREEGAASIVRKLSFEDGTLAGTLPPVALALEPDEGTDVACQTLLDLLPVSSLPAGDYLFSATLETGSTRASSKPAGAPFAIATPPSSVEPATEGNAP